MRSFYLQGDGEARSLIFAPAHLHLDIVHLDKKGISALQELSYLDYGELVDYVMSKNDRALGLVLGKTTLFDEKYHEEWAVKAWIPQTDRIVEFPEVEDFELQQAFRDYIERQKQKRLEELREAERRRSASKLMKHKKKEEPKQEERLTALQKLRRLKHKS